MAKKGKYPKKLRISLERVAEKRQEREAEAERARYEDRVLDTLFHDFLPKGSVHLIHAKPNDELTQMEATYYLSPRYEYEAASVTPPWPPLEKPDPE